MLGAIRDKPALTDTDCDGASFRRVPTARATSSPIVTSEATAWVPIVSLARRLSGIDKLADRAKEAKDRVHASASDTKEKSQVSEARASADKTTQELKARAADSQTSPAHVSSAEGPPHRPRRSRAVAAEAEEGALQNQGQQVLARDIDCQRRRSS